MGKQEHVEGRIMRLLAREELQFSSVTIKLVDCECGQHKTIEVHCDYSQELEPLMPQSKAEAMKNPQQTLELLEELEFILFAMDDSVGKKLAIIISLREHHEEMMRQEKHKRN